MNQIIKFAILGFGNIGKRYFDILNAHPEANLVCIIDPKLEGFGQNVLYFKDFKDFLKTDLEVDVIVIATPNGLHYAQALEALKAGKHVVIEKPMVLKSSEAIHLKELANLVSKQIFNVVQNRYSPIAQWLKRIVESGDLGKIYWVQTNCFWNRDQRYYKPNSWQGSQNLDGGVLYTQFYHYLDIIYWLFGGIKNIKASFYDFNHEKLTEFEDSGILNFEFKNGGIGTFNYTTSLWDKNLESSMTIIAENGTIKTGGQYMEKIDYCHVKDDSVSDISIEVLNNEVKNNHSVKSNHTKLIDNILNVLKGKENFISTMDESIRLIQTIEKKYDLKN